MRVSPWMLNRRRANRGKSLRLTIALSTAVLLCLTSACARGASDHPAKSDSLARRDVPDSSYTDTALHRELISRVERDQGVREIFAKDLRTTGKLRDSTVRAMMAVDSQNVAWLKPLIARGVLPTRAQVGPDGLSALFLLVQHADQDVDFQESVLPLLQQAFDHGEVNGEKLAMLTDRVAKARKRPQLYGTQSTIVDGHAIIDPIADSAGVDARRMKMGLLPLARYKFLLDSMYGQQPKK